MPRSPSSTPATPGAVVEESASPPKPGLFARLFKKAPKVDDEAKTPSPEKPKKEAASARLRAPRSLSGAIKALEGTRRINDSDDDRLPESGAAAAAESHYRTRREARRVGHGRAHQAGSVKKGEEAVSAARAAGPSRSAAGRAASESADSSQITSR